jgi:4-amino-4-deoxy-L-arabinose transferase-like glycosyltransferase
MTRRLERFSNNPVLLAICGFSFVIRVIYRIHAGEPDFWVNGYTSLYKFAENIVAGKGLWLEETGFAVRPPIYPWFLTLAAWAGGSYLWVVLPQALFGAATVAFAYLIGKWLFGERAALLSAALTAIYPYYVVHDTALEETSLVTMLTAISVYALLRAQKSAKPTVWGAAGIALAVDALCRLTMLPWALAALIWIGLFGDGSWKMRALRGGVGFLCLAALVGVWVARNDNLLGRPVLSSETGFNFWVGHNPQTFSHYPAEPIDLSTFTAYRALSREDKETLDAVSTDELARNDWFLRRGLNYVRAHPGEAVLGAARKVAAGFDWRLNPLQSPSAEAVYGLSYVPIAIFGVWGMIMTRARWRELGVIYLLFASFVAVTAVFWAHTVHRTHLDVYLIVFSATALTRFAGSAAGGRDALLWGASRKPSAGERARFLGSDNS